MCEILGLHCGVAVQHLRRSEMLGFCVPFLLTNMQET